MDTNYHDLVDEFHSLFDHWVDFFCLPGYFAEVYCHGHKVEQHEDCVQIVIDCCGWMTRTDQDPCDLLFKTSLFIRKGERLTFAVLDPLFERVEYCDSLKNLSAYVCAMMHANFMVQNVSPLVEAEEAVVVG